MKSRILSVIISSVTAAMIILYWPAFFGVLTKTPEDPVLAGDSGVSAEETTMLFVDVQMGTPDASGKKGAPVNSLSVALAKIPDPLDRSVTIVVAPGNYEFTGATGMPADRLVLMRRMPPGVIVKIVALSDTSGARPILAWGPGSEPMVDVREGDWWIEGLQIGSFTTKQRIGVQVASPGHLTIKNTTFRMRSESGAGIYAHRGGVVSLRGAILMNEHLHDGAEDETFCGIIATDHGIVQFVETQTAFLDMGNGSLAVSNYGRIALGCDTARITSRGWHSNNLAVNNGGRIDLGATRSRLKATQGQNTPIGMEHDGHILGEGAEILIEGNNAAAIQLQKFSSFTCNKIELRGNFKYAVVGQSGSMFAGMFQCDIGAVEATTGSTVHILQVDGTIRGPVVAAHGGMITLPDRDIHSH